MEIETGELAPMMAGETQASLGTSAELGSLSGALARQQGILKSVRAGSTPNRIFWPMNGLATVIACDGLRANNIVAIQVAFSVVFRVGGYRWLTSGRKQSIGSFLRRNGVGLALISLFAVVLGIQFHKVLSNSLFESQVRTVLGRDFGGASDLRVISIDISKTGHDTVVSAVVRGPRQSSAALDDEGDDHESERIDR